MKHIVSLGDTCSVAYQKRTLGYDEAYYPFDWIKTPKFADVNSLISNKFEGLLDNLTFKSKSNKFPIDSGSSDDTHFFISVNNADESNIYQNNMCTFYHDFRDGVDFEEQLTAVKDKYKRRIQRFYSLLESKGKIIFVRDQIKPNQINDKQLNEFHQIISKYKNSATKEDDRDFEYHLVIILHNPSNKKLSLLQYNHPNTTIINDNNRFGDWKRPNIDWNLIFNVI